MYKKDYSKNKHCKCGKSITNKSKSCQSCSKKELYKDSTKNPMFGKHLTKEHKKKIGKANFKIGLPKCKVCKKEISYGHKKCKKCYHKTQIGHLFSNKSKKLLSKSLKKYYKTHNSHLRGKKRPEHSKLMKGKNNPNFIIGISKTGYPYKFKNFGEIIRKRDNYTCQKCGKQQEKNYRKLDVHHIDYNKQNCNKNNLITLCYKCNILANFDRDYWYSYFKYIMENR